MTSNGAPDEQKEAVLRVLADGKALSNTQVAEAIGRRDARGMHLILGALERSGDVVRAGEDWRIKE